MAKTRRSYPKRDLTIEKFGMLTPVEWIRGGFWRCVCDCGRETIVDTRNLTTGHTQSCGCMRYQTKNIADMTDYEDDNIKVIARSGRIGEVAAWKCICKHCGRTFRTRGSNIRFGYTQSCGCRRSRNEQKIASLLLKNGIDFEKEYSFPDLVGVGGKPLRFDFAIFKNGQLKRLIEFNGLQHYEKPGGAWSNRYDVNIENDRRKIDYCKYKGIDLKIIKYCDDYDLDDILY